MTDEQQKKIFSKNLRYYVHLSGKQQKEIAEALGVNQKNLQWMVYRTFHAKDRNRTYLKKYRIYWVLS